MAAKQTGKALKNKAKFSKTTMVVFVAVIAGIGGWLIVSSYAARLSTTTMLFNDTSDINASFGSSGYTVVNDMVGIHSVPVAQISTGGSISYGGKGGGTTATPVALQLCYSLRVNSGTTATVQLIGPGATVTTRTIKAWPYDSGPAPYQYECVTKGTVPQKSVPDVQVLSGGPVYVYNREVLVTYPY